MISPIGKVSNKPQTHPGSMARWLDGGINGSIDVARWLDANGGCLQPQCLDARLHAGLDAKLDAGSMRGSMPRGRAPRGSGRDARVPSLVSHTRIGDLHQTLCGKVRAIYDITPG